MPYIKPLKGGSPYGELFFCEGYYWLNVYRKSIIIHSYNYIKTVVTVRAVIVI